MTKKSEEVNVKAQAIDRVKVLLNEPILEQHAQFVGTNAVVAIYQIAYQNELNGILYGLGLPSVRLVGLPLRKSQKQAIIKAVNKL